MTTPAEGFRAARSDAPRHVALRAAGLAQATAPSCFAAELPPVVVVIPRPPP